MSKDPIGRIGLRNEHPSKNKLNIKIENFSNILISLKDERTQYKKDL